jgi:hypothetical protein
VPLFEDLPRSDPGVMTHVEDMYTFLNRVDDPVFERIRQLLNGWFARYEALQPARAANDVAARLRAKQPLQFEGAFWELYLHEAHVRLSFEVTTCPEDVRHPDFVLAKQSARVYLEATVTGKSPVQTWGTHSAAQIHDWINTAQDPNFFVRVEVIAPGDDTPKRHEVVNPLEAWLRALAESWRALRDALECGERVDFPRCRIPIRGWLLEFEAFPKSEKARAESSFPVIGLYPAQAAWEGDSAVLVRAKLDGKAKHYGDLDAPFIVAIRDVTPFASRGVMNKALFGLERPYWTEGVAAPNRVSAVLAASDFGMSSPARKTPELWINPYARHPLPSALLPWPVVGGSTAAAIDPAALFGLSRDWPGKPFETL